MFLSRFLLFRKNVNITYCHVKKKRIKCCVINMYMRSVYDEPQLKLLEIVPYDIHIAIKFAVLNNNENAAEEFVLIMSAFLVDWGRS